MSWQKASTSLIDYDEGHLSTQQRADIQALLKKDSNLAQELEEIRLLKRALKVHAPAAAQPRDPEGLTRSILSKIKTPSQSSAAEPIPFWEKLRERILHLLQPATLAWGVAAASCVLAVIFGLQSLKSNQQLEALLHNQANEKLLFQVAQISFKHEEAKAKNKLELSELMEWSGGDMDVIQVIDRTGKLPSEKAYKEILHITPSSDKSHK